MHQSTLRHLLQGAAAPIFASLAILAGTTLIAHAQDYVYEIPDDGSFDAGAVARRIMHFRPSIPNVHAIQSIHIPSPGQSYVNHATRRAHNEEIYRWPENKLPIKVFIGAGECVKGYQSSFRQFLVEAYTKWADASNGKLSWQLVDSKADADVVCAWTDELPTIATGAEAGRTRVNTSFNTETREGIISHATMDLRTVSDDGRPFTQAEMKRICLHEVGHAFGIETHSPYHDDIMYHAVSPTQPPVLSQRDKYSIQELYRAYPTVNALNGNEQSRNENGGPQHS
jgi:predicted Zn-dependent protease